MSSRFSFHVDMKFIGKFTCLLNYALPLKLGYYTSTEGQFMINLFAVDQLELASGPAETIS